MTKQLIKLTVSCFTAMVMALAAGKTLAQSVVAEVAAATKGPVGGIFIRTRAPTLGPVSNVRFDPVSKAIVSDGWRYSLPVSTEEASEVFKVISSQNFLAADVSTKGEARIFGLAQTGRVANRMLVADLLLGDIAKGFGYFAPLYRTANGYQPRQYNPIGFQRFAVFFVFNSAAWRIENGQLISEPAKLEGVGAPFVAKPDGTRSFDFAAIDRKVQDAAITDNINHMVANESYYRRERVVRDMQAYADLAQLAIEMKSQSIDIGSLIKP